MADEVDKVDINRSKPLRCVARLTLEYRNCGGDIWIWPTNIKLLTADAKCSGFELERTLDDNYNKEF